MHCTRRLNVCLRHTFRHSFREKCFLRRACRRRKLIIFLFSLRQKNSARLYFHFKTSVSLARSFFLRIQQRGDQFGFFAPHFSASNIFFEAMRFMCSSVKLTGRSVLFLRYSANRPAGQYSKENDSKKCFVRNL